MNLNNYDMHFCIKRLPWGIRTLMEKYGEQMIIAGGYIRSVIAGETISDIDVFAGNKTVSNNRAMELARGDKRRLHTTDNAITVNNLSIPVQFVHRWVFDNPLGVLQSFDFSICQAAIWYDEAEKKWLSICGKKFYQDLSAKRLVYQSPIRNEDVGGSILRVLKYYQRGYRIPLDSFGSIIARLLSKVRNNPVLTEEQMAKVITGLLVEVDPASFIDHEAYLPSEKKLEEAI